MNDIATDALKPMSEIQIAQTRAFIDGLESGSIPYWDAVEIGEEKTRNLTLSAELIVLYADGVEDFNPWYEGWTMNGWTQDGNSPFGGAIVPPLLVSHFVLAVQFDHTKPFSIGSIHTFHESTIVSPIPVGTTVEIRTRAIDKFEKRGRRYVRHEVDVTGVDNGEHYFHEIRDIMSL